LRCIFRKTLSLSYSSNVTSDIADQAERPDQDRHASSDVVDMAALGSMLRNRRLENGLSVRQAAQDANVSFSTITRVESGAQPDLATFLKLCGWLGVRPEQFFLTGARRDQNAVETVVQHLFADPALDSTAAEQIATMIRQMYRNLATHAIVRPAIACHLRAAPIMRAGVPEKLHTLLDDLHQGVLQMVNNGEL
jgi:transcriptional regulator with XRE-family HTH domain